MFHNFYKVNKVIFIITGKVEGNLEKPEFPKINKKKVVLHSTKFYLWFLRLYLGKFSYTFQKSKNKINSCLTVCDYINKAARKHKKIKN